VLATIFYGYAVNFAKRYLPNSNALVNATNSQIGAALALAVPTVLWWPIEPVSTLAWFSVVTLGVFCTGLAYVLYFRLIHRIGASRAITVVFVIPIFATLFGVVFLQETLSISMVVSGLIIMLGSAFSLQLLPRK